MKILSVECSASPASVAVIENGKIIANSFVNVKLTHSETLMPMIDATLKSAKLSIKDIEGFSVAAGPGSFTGIRIGISVVKGLAAADNLPCLGVSTLEAMAYMFSEENITVCAVMDARCNQFYNALFKIKNGKVSRLCDDRAISFDELKTEIKNISDNVVICGDGADIFYNNAKEDLCNIKLASENLKYQSAVGVGIMSEKYFSDKNTVLSNELLPVYLRLPQAERELKNKKSKEG
ncbi:MAG: tRNA (adenosine(37)-N6)-threonylcarbamoyltransferase complex dimerization subunit type 1 TsaB [Clostridia bacterium]|nr:tRNA (adenosine(37)-N6)-threonylcarbamoyltransferase complex dimerization subunit type 1 TsaB [Clostridia bacterium]